MGAKPFKQSHNFLSNMTYPLESLKQEITNQLITTLKKLNYKCEIKLDTPPENMGDFAFPCFPLASIAKKPPHKIAEEIAKQTKKSKWIKEIKAQGPYVNFYIDTTELTKKTLNLISKMKKNYGNLENKNKKVIIEHTSANPNGPLHVGRARNPIIGDTIVRIFKAAGYNVESQFYLDDMGKQVAILTWGVNNITKKDIPISEFNKPDHQSVGYYQKANSLMQEDKKIADQISEIIKKSELGDPKALKQGKEAYDPVLLGINESLNRINIQIDKYIPESKFVQDKSVDTVVTQLKKNKNCSIEDDAYYLDLESFGIHGRNTKFFFTRKDGTTLYATRDIAYHLWKTKQADLLINILGEDHKLESKQVEIALQMLKAKIIPTPIFYSFVSLPEGKMSTRRGRVVYVDELIDEIITRAYKEVKKRRQQELTEKQMKKIAEIVGIGALRYNIIKVQPEKDIQFKWEEALNFEGNAAPFIQYSHARACSILSKAKISVKEIDASLLKHESEIQLVKQLTKLPEIIDEASTGFKPHSIASYLFETASKFNQFYRDCPVLPEKNIKLRNMRLKLVESSKIVLANGLQLLGITAPEEM